VIPSAAACRSGSVPDQSHKAYPTIERISNLMFRLQRALIILLLILLI
jgi:hypothetical protein